MLLVYCVQEMDNKQKREQLCTIINVWCVLSLRCALRGPSSKNGEYTHTRVGTGWSIRVDGICGPLYTLLRVLVRIIRSLDSLDKASDSFVNGEYDCLA